MLGLALQNGDLKRETESLIVAAQNQSVRTNLVKARIDKSQGDSLCRVCRKVDESIDHIVSGCSKLAQKEYKRRHENLRKIVHWKLAKLIKAWRPDLVQVDKKERICKIIDFVVPGDSRIEEKEEDKIGKNQDLRRELQKI